MHTRSSQRKEHLKKYKEGLEREPRRGEIADSKGSLWIRAVSHYVVIRGVLYTTWRLGGSPRIIAVDIDPSP